MKALEREHGGWFARWMKRRNERALNWALSHGRIVLGIAIASVVIAAASVPFLPRSFLPQFNEGNIYVTLLLNPDVSLTDSFSIGHMAEQILMQVPEVKAMSRRSGHYENDSDIDPVNENEMPLV